MNENEKLTTEDPGTESPPKTTTQYDWYDYSTSRPRQNDDDDDDDFLPSKDEVDEQTLKIEKFTRVVTQASKEELKMAGHQFADLITNCTWRGVSCKNR